MTRYALAAVPWRLALTGTAVLAGLLALVGQWPYVLWPLQGTAVGLVAGVVAWSLDERAAAIVDTLPRALWWRTAARSVTVPLVLAAWVGGLVAVRHRLPDHLGLFVLQGVAAALLAAAVCSWRRAAGTAEPGRVFAAYVVPAAAAVALARPVADHLPVFPVWPPDPWVASGVLWAAVAGLSALGLLWRLPRA